MKALVLTDSPVWTAETEYAVSVARAESRAGVAVTFASPHARFADEVPEARALALPGDSPSRSPADFVACARWLSDLARWQRFGLVHTVRATAHLLGALAVGRSAPLVHLRGGATPPATHAANRFLYRRLTRAVIVSSERVRAWVVDGLGVPAVRAHRLLAPVDTDVFRPRGADLALARSLGVPDGASVVMNVARLAPVKGQAVLVEAMARVIGKEENAVLVLVGEPWSGEPAGLRELAGRLGIAPSVIFAGRRDDVDALLGLASVCVSSSLGSEENSRAVSEYMAAGRPVVATSVGVVPELVVDGRSGLLVPPGDAGALADAVVALLAAPERALSMGVAARREAVQSFSESAFSAGLARALGEAGVTP